MLSDPLLMINFLRIFFFRPFSIFLSLSLLLILITNGFLNHFYNNFINLNDFLGIKFLEPKLHALVKHLLLNEVNQVIPLLLFVWQWLNLI